MSVHVIDLSVFMRLGLCDVLPLKMMTVKMAPDGRAPRTRTPAPAMPIGALGAEVTRLGGKVLGSLVPDVLQSCQEAYSVTARKLYERTGQDDLGYIALSEIEEQMRRDTDAEIRALIEAER